MLKNLIPLIIVIVIISIGGLGLYFIMNQKTTPIDINSKTDDNSFAPVTSAPSPATPVPNSANINSQTFPDGLRVEDERIGTGSAVKAGDNIYINYLGTLENGQKFDSSYDRGQPFETQIGVGQVIKGWDEGVIGMKVGGKRKLIIPPSLGYGNQAAGPIPANSTLIFEVELLGIK